MKIVFLKEKNYLLCYCAKPNTDPFNGSMTICITLAFGIFVCNILSQKYVLNCNISKKSFTLTKIPLSFYAQLNTGNIILLYVSFIKYSDKICLLHSKYEMIVVSKLMKIIKKLAKSRKWVMKCQGHSYFLPKIQMISIQCFIRFDESFTRILPHIYDQFLKKDRNNIIN